jgi:hypothetical protein
MIRLSGPRCLAMSVTGTLFGVWINSTSATDMARYRSLSHEELLTELAASNGDVLSTSIMGGLFLVLTTVVIVDILTRVFRAVWLRIEPPGSRPADAGTPKAA